MDDKIDITPLLSFLETEITPVDLSRLLGEFIYDYIDKLIRLQQLDEEQSLHIDSVKFIYFTRKLRDALLSC